MRQRFALVMGLLCMLLVAVWATPAAADPATNLIIADLVRGLELGNSAIIDESTTLVDADLLAEMDEMQPAVFDHRTCDLLANTDFELAENDNSGWSAYGDGSLVAYTRPVAGHDFDDASNGDLVNTVMPAADLRRYDPRLERLEPAFLV